MCNIYNLLKTPTTPLTFYQANRSRLSFDNGTEAIGRRLQPDMNTSYKKRLMKYLEQNSIQTRSFFFPLHQQPKLKKYKNDECAVTKSIYKKGLCLPIHHKLSEKNIRFICRKIKIFFENE